MLFASTGCKFGIGADVDVTPQIASRLARGVYSIYFASDSAKILGESKVRLAYLISDLNQSRNVTLVLRGYTDQVEKPILASKRLKAVNAALINVTAANNIIIKQEECGSSDPLTSYNTVANNPQSRRVDAFVTVPLQQP
jgi:outer membrane protein OmpA-like peptidoglycan-associated protein